MKPSSFVGSCFGEVQCFCHVSMPLSTSTLLIFFFSFQVTYYRDKTREASFQDQDQEQLDTEFIPDSQQNQVPDE